MKNLMELGELFEVTYEDRGCKESKSCLSCPLPVCIHDDPVLQRKTARAREDAERANAVLLASKTMSRPDAIRKVAKDFGVTERTIWRILERTK